MKMSRLVCLLCLGASLVGCESKVYEDYTLNYRYWDNGRVIALDIKDIPDQKVKEEMYILGHDSASDGVHRTVVETVNGRHHYVMVFDELGRVIAYSGN